MDDLSEDGRTPAGKLLWRVPLGGPMDSPPTLHNGLCLLGTQDGWIHALRLSDGQLAWRFFAAPCAVPAMLHGRLASALPVPGSVLVFGDTLLATAGYPSYLGGIQAWALDPTTGQVRGRSALVGGNAPRETPMVLNDVLCASLDGKSAWIFRDYLIGPDAQRLPVPRRAAGSVHPAYPALAACTDRRAALMRFTHDPRGGSTHGWGHPMGSGDTLAPYPQIPQISQMEPGKEPEEMARVKKETSLIPSLGFTPMPLLFSSSVESVKSVDDDPREGDNRFRTGPHVSKTPILFAKRAEARRGDPPLWGRTPADLGFRESYTSLIKAGDRLYLGGGKRDGTAGLGQVVSATDGKLLQELELPGQGVACGLAAAGGWLYARRLDGSVACCGGAEE